MLNDIPEVIWTNNQPMIEKTSIDIVTSEMFNDLYSFMGKFPLHSASLNFEKKEYGEILKFNLVLYDKGNDYYVQVNRLTRHFITSHGQIDAVSEKKEKLKLYDFSDVVWLWEDNNPSEEQKSYVFSNVVEEFKKIILAHSLEQGRVSFPNDSEFQDYNVHLLNQPDVWAIAAVYGMKADPNSPVAGTRIPK